jgi:hypothetical protein
MSAPLASDNGATRSRIFNGGLNGRALLLERDPATAREVSRVLRTVVGHTDVRESFSKVERHAEWDLAVINYDQLAQLERERIFTRFGSLNATGGLLLLAGQSERDELISLFGRHRARKLLARNGPVHAEDLLVTVQKTLRKELFGIDKYLGWGAQAQRMSLRSSTEKESVLGQCEALANTVGLSDRKSALLMTVAEELTTNALYDAPVDGVSRARHAALPRSERVELAPSEEILVTLATDGRRVGISVEDPFGSLKPDTVVEYLAKCLRRGADQIDRKQGGAGLGLFYTFNSLSHFVINIDPRKRTEVIGLIEVSGSFRDFEQRAKSFNVFVQD